MPSEKWQKHSDNAQVASDGSSLSDEGDRRIVELGYEPVFKREFGRLSSFSFAFSISASTLQLQRPLSMVCRRVVHQHSSGVG